MVWGAGGEMEVRVVGGRGWSWKGVGKKGIWMGEELERERKGARGKGSWKGVEGIWIGGKQS